MEKRRDEEKEGSPTILGSTSCLCQPGFLKVYGSPKPERLSKPSMIFKDALGGLPKSPLSLEEIATHRPKALEIVGTEDVGKVILKP
jgi:hypothetical protein